MQEDGEISLEKMKQIGQCGNGISDIKSKFWMIKDELFKVWWVTISNNSMGCSYLLWWSFKAQSSNSIDTLISIIQNQLYSSCNVHIIVSADSAHQMYQATTKDGGSVASHSHNNRLLKCAQMSCQQESKTDKSR